MTSDPDCGWLYDHNLYFSGQRAGQDVYICRTCDAEVLVDSTPPPPPYPHERGYVLKSHHHTYVLYVAPGFPPPDPHLWTPSGEHADGTCVYHPNKGHP